MSNGPAWKGQRLALLEAQAKARQHNKLNLFAPYPKQEQFFEIGATKRERLLMAGNQLGKSEAGAFELACHLTGLYPQWWVGKRFDRPIRAWAGGVSGEMVRNVSQLKLCGTPGSEEDWGTGMIPKALLVGKSAGHGVADLLDGIKVRHVSGGVSTLNFKTYEQGRGKWQGATLDAIWWDEEPPMDIYSEGLARLTGDGCTWMTFTPLLGWSEVVSRFLRDDSPDARRDRGVVRMGIRDAMHFTEEQKAQRLASYPAHEREARAEGTPLLGSGAVFEGVIESDISTSMLLSDTPKHWPLMWSIDFGISHPFAAVLLAWDRDTDCVYVLHTIKMQGQIPLAHADAMKRIAPNVPVAWPHDGNDREKGSGEPLAALYKAQGLRMLPTHATFAAGGYSTEAGVADLLARMRSDRFKVGSHLRDWWDEFRIYHRKDGLIVKVNDDLLSATRIGVMSIRKAPSPRRRTVSSAATAIVHEAAPSTPGQERASNGDDQRIPRPVAPCRCPGARLEASPSRERPGHLYADRRVDERDPCRRPERRGGSAAMCRGDRAGPVTAMNKNARPCKRAVIGI
jgi:phage terminase large subunit-like protein